MIIIIIKGEIRFVLVMNQGGMCVFLRELGNILEMKSELATGIFDRVLDLPRVRCTGMTL